MSFFMSAHFLSRLSIGLKIDLLPARRRAISSDFAIMLPGASPPWVRDEDPVDRADQIGEGAGRTR
jgi:hypothetical protein